MKKFLGMFALLAIVASPAMALNGGDLYAEKGCIGCHGVGGKSEVSINPSLRGQHAEYIATQAKLIRDGKRNAGMTAMMKPMLAGVSDAELDAIADYLSQQ